MFSFCESCVLNDGVLLTNKGKMRETRSEMNYCCFFCLFSSIHCSILCLQLNNYKARTVSALVLALCIQRDKGKEKQQKTTTRQPQKRAMCISPSAGKRSSTIDETPFFSALPSGPFLSHFVQKWIKSERHYMQRNACTHIHILCPFICFVFLFSLGYVGYVSTLRH